MQYMDFGEAIRRMKGGWVVAREGWNGKDMNIQIQVPDAGSKMNLPYIYMTTATAELVPWLASQSDMLAEDWTLVYLKGEESDEGYRVRSYFTEPYFGVSRDRPLTGNAEAWPMPKTRTEERTDAAQDGYREARDAGAYNNGPKFGGFAAGRGPSQGRHPDSPRERI